MYDNITLRSLSYLAIVRPVGLSVVNFIVGKRSAHGVLHCYTSNDLFTLSTWLTKGQYWVIISNIIDNLISICIWHMNIFLKLRITKDPLFVFPFSRPTHYAHGLYFAVFSCDEVLINFIYICQGYFTGTGTTTSLIARFMGPIWAPSGADRTQVGPMLAPWSLLSGMRTLIPMKIPRKLWVRKFH